MTNALTIAHISDLHLSAEHKRQNLRRAHRLLSAIRSYHVDHVAFTGDVAADATRADFDVARRLLKGHRLLDPSKLSLVIGNHDVFGGVHTPEDILGYPRRCRGTDFDGKVEEFRQHFHETFNRSFFASHDRPFPYAKVLGDVVLVGVNSVAPYSKVKNPVGSNGEVDDEQFGLLQLLLSAPPLKSKRKIILIHHHFHKIVTIPTGTLGNVWGAVERQTMKMRGKKRLLDLFRLHDVALVMHGHVHTNATYERQGVTILNGGGSLLGPGSPRATFNLIRINQHTVETRTITVPEEALSIPALPPRVYATADDLLAA
ncbi:MAG: metallophosphoesterase [Bacteroidota bacterium]